MKHKHCELIKAWADGSEIEVFSECCNDWIFNRNPRWQEDREYRIKPEPKPDVVVKEFMYFDLENEEWMTTNCNTPNLKLTFDGETGELKSAEVLK